MLKYTKFSLSSSCDNFACEHIRNTVWVGEFRGHNGDLECLNKSEEG